MATRSARVIGRIAYGAVFVVAVPLLLYFWARATSSVISMPGPHSKLLGILILGCGAVLIVSAWLTLLTRANGLPMNAFPPERFVRSLVYRYFADPIYIGFGLCCLGASIMFGSASGFWLVTPIVGLAMSALVWGYERAATRQRFGSAAHEPPLISLPDGSYTTPSGWDRASVYILVLVPWLVIYQLIQWVGPAPDAISSYLSFEHDWPVLQWTFVGYASAYVVLPIIPLLLPTRHNLREFALAGNVATFAITLAYFVIPFVAPPRSFVPDSWAGQLLAADRIHDNTVASFPSFHVVWAALAAHYLALAYPRLKYVAWVWAVIVAVTCITTGMHSLADVTFGAITYSVVARWRQVWGALRKSAERIANSWREWRIGRVRIINHGFYAGLGAAVGTYIACAASGAPVWAVVLVGLCSVGGAGLWAQALEGSSVLLRPFGYYGAIVGGLVATLLLSLWRSDGVLIMAGYALGAPWVQVFGRLRCLVQGCCHGRQAPASIGIRYSHPRSRVHHVSGLTGVPIHPTPLYSILSNIVIGVVLARLWSLHTAPTLIAGLYLMLNPIARFVEESLRGEPQTPVVFGLRIYQWTALASFLIGMFITVLPSAPAPTFHMFDQDYFVGALVLFVITSGAMGLDFPLSNARFSRLASADELISEDTA